MPKRKQPERKAKAAPKSKKNEEKKEELEQNQEKKVKVDFVPALEQLKKVNT